MAHTSKGGLWLATKQLTSVLLAIWLLVNLVGPWFARDLDRLLGLGFPFGFWVAAQGALLLYLAIIVVYVVAMERIEKRQPEPADDDGSGTGAA